MDFGHSYHMVRLLLANHLVLEAQQLMCKTVDDFVGSPSSAKREEYRCLLAGCADCSLFEHGLKVLKKFDDQM